MPLAPYDRAMLDAHSLSAVADLLVWHAGTSSESSGQGRISRSSGQGQGHKGKLFLRIAYQLVSGKVVCYHRYVREWSDFD